MGCMNAKRFYLLLYCLVLKSNKLSSLNFASESIWTPFSIGLLYKLFCVQGCMHARWLYLPVNLNSIQNHHHQAVIPQFWFISVHRFLHLTLPYRIPVHLATCYQFWNFVNFHWLLVNQLVSHNGQAKKLVIMFTYCRNHVFTDIAFLYRFISFWSCPDNLDWETGTKQWIITHLSKPVLTVLKTNLSQSKLSPNQWCFIHV